MCISDLLDTYKISLFIYFDISFLCYVKNFLFEK